MYNRNNINIKTITYILKRRGRSPPDCDLANWKDLLQLLSNKQIVGVVYLLVVGEDRLLLPWPGGARGVTCCR